MVKNIRYQRLKTHLDTLPSRPHMELMNQIDDRHMDLYKMYEFLQRFDDHVLMMAICRPYLRLAIERGANLRQKNIGGWAALEIARQLYPDETKENKKMILRWLREHPQ